MFFAAAEGGFAPGAFEAVGDGVFVAAIPSRIASCTVSPSAANGFP